MIRTGYGYDSHRFKESPYGMMRLCGIDLPHTHKLDGHSDADAPLHAMTDALLSAIGEGDIGTYFPPSDPQWKGKDSAFFLRHACDLVKVKKMTIVNAGVTIICEQPRIGPHREAMKQRLAAILDMAAEDVNIAAKTNEKMGSIGRGEGLVAHAVVSLCPTALYLHFRQQGWVP